MIIVSICEKTIPSLLKKGKIALKKGAMVEARLDALTSFSEKDIVQLERELKPLYTLRSKKEGGASSLSPKKREQALKLLIDAKVSYLDLEYARDKKHIPYLKKTSPKTKLILSYHDTKKVPERLSSLVKSMKALSPWRVKVVGLVKKTFDSIAFLELSKKDPKVIAIAMGEHGYLTRILPRAFSQPITYAALDAKSAAAPGQLTVDALENTYNYSKLGARTKLLGIIGNPLTLSPGYRVYNAIFKKKKINALYVNIELERGEAKKAVDRFRALGFFGLSVTIPFKEEVMRVVTHLDPKQKGITSANSLKFSKGRVYAKNTDAIGAVNYISEYISVRGKKVLILGAGGTAKGIGYLMKKKGAKVLFTNRTESKSKALAKSLGASHLPFSSLKCLKKEDYDILVQVTSVGSKDPNQSLLEPKAVYSKKVILDVVFTQTKLLKIARRVGAHALTGKEFWVYQGLEQLKFWFSKLPANLPDLMKKELL